MLNHITGALTLLLGAATLVSHLSPALSVDVEMSRDDAPLDSKSPAQPRRKPILPILLFLLLILKLNHKGDSAYETSPDLPAVRPADDDDERPVFCHGCPFD